MTKYATLVPRVDVLPHALDTALTRAVTPRPGPVHLTVPVDVLNAELDAGALPPRAPAMAAVSASSAGERTLVRQAADMLAASERPVMVVGSGAFYARAWPEVSALAARADIPILSHIWDRGCVEEAVPHYVGVTNGELNGAMTALAEADLVLTVGARVDYRLWHGRPPEVNPAARFVRVDADPGEVSRVVVPEVGIAGDPRLVLQDLLAELAGCDVRPHAGWLAQVRAARDSLLDEWADQCLGEVCPVPGLRICREIKPFLDRDVTFLLDGGNIGRWAHMVLFDRHPAHWFTCGISGVVGWGLPGAVAAKLARPDEPLLLLSGDGAAGFTVTEIETALRFGTPYVAVIAHDGAWGIVADGQPPDRRVASEFGEIRFDRVAQALGARGVLIEDPRELGPAIEGALESDTVTVIQVPTQQAGIGCWRARYGPGSRAC